MTLDLTKDLDTAVAWRPDATYLDRSRLLRLMRAHGVDDLRAWLDWSSADIGRYWGTVVDDLGLEFHRPFSSVVDLSRGAPWPEWFVDGGFNYVANAVDRHLPTATADKTAIVWEGDDGEARRWTYRELVAETGRLSNALRGLGIEKGDRVGIFLPMLPETVAAVLACGKVGAIYTPLFSGFGEEAIASRLRDCDARLLITADGFFRGGSKVDMKSVADRALLTAPSVTDVVVLRRTGDDVDWIAVRDRWWHDLVAEQPDESNTEPTAASDPYMIIYTSGTTGAPKGALHVHAGFPIKATHDLAYCFDLHADDNLFWYTDLGWMMGPWAIAGALTLGATLTIFEGTPFHPGPDRLWRIVADHGVTVLGVAPTAIRALIPHGTEPVEAHDLSSLRVLGSTGEAWNPGPWRWYFEHVGGGRCPVINYSGGTETGGGIVSGSAIAPLKPCGFAGPVPGMDADVVDDAGKPIRGAVGELVVRQPWVGMTRGFWNADERYLDTYWSRFPDTWVHGDWAEVDADGAWFIRGRSDDTLKVAGKRIGPAEVESAAVAHPAVQEAAAIGVPHEIKGEGVVVFCILRPDRAAESVRGEIRETISRLLGAPMRPERVVVVAELPRTRNAKIMRRVIRAAYLGLPRGDVTALENPAAVEAIAALGLDEETT